jgi:L-lactate dehydrogenase complex protein LldE
MNVELFIPCLMDQLYPAIAWNTVDLLKKVGCTIHYNKEQTCCGYPSWVEGRKDTTQPIAEKWINDYKTTPYPIVTPSLHCYKMIKEHYGQIFTNSTHHLKMKNAQSKLIEIGTFLDTNEVDLSQLSPPVIKLYYMQSCDSSAFSPFEHTRSLLSKFDGIEIVNKSHEGLCCGAGGALPKHYEDASIEMAKRTVQKALDTSAEAIITNEIYCYAHINGYIEKNNIDIDCYHLSEFLMLNNL